MIYKLLRYLLLITFMVAPMHMVYAVDLLLGDKQKLGPKGDDLSISMANLSAGDNRGNVIEIHQGSNNSNLYSRSGTWVLNNTDTGTINWDSNDYQYRDSNHNLPSISINNQGNYVTTHNTKSNIGALGDTNLWVIGGRLSGAQPLDNNTFDTLTATASSSRDYRQSISLNNDNLFATISRRNNGTFYSLGRVNADGTDSWITTMLGVLFPGNLDFMSISLTDDNKVMVAHQNDSNDSDVFVTVGIVNEAGKKIHWISTKKITVGQRPTVSLNDNGLFVIRNKGKSSDSTAYRIGRLDDDFNIVDIQSVDTNNERANKRMSVSVTNEGYVADIFADSTASNDLYSRVSVLAGEKVIKSTDWFDSTTTIYNLISTKRYKFGFFARDNCFQIYDGNDQPLLTQVVKNQYNSFVAQAQGGEITLKLVTSQCAGLARDLVTAITVDQEKPSTRIRNQALLDMDDNDITALLGDELWELQAELPNHYSYKFSNVSDGAMLSLGFSVANQCVIIEQGNTQIYGPESLHGVNEHYSIDVAGNINNEIDLTLNTSNCNDATISELISHVDVIENVATTKILPTETQTNEGMGWSYDPDPEHDYFITTISNLTPHHPYALVGRIDPNYNCFVVMNDEDEILLNSNKYIANALTNADGEIDLILNTNGNANSMCNTNIPINEYMTDISVYSQQSTITFSNRRDDWQQVDDHTYALTLPLPHAGPYYIAGGGLRALGIATEAVLTIDGTPFNSSYSSIVLADNNTIVLTLAMALPSAPIENIINPINLVTDIPNLPLTRGITTSQCVLVDSDNAYDEAWAC